MSGTTAPTGEKPQSKLWFNDGIWWGVLYNKGTRHFEIYRFNWAIDIWTTTGVMVDARSSSSADALWSGSRLYTVSNVPAGASGDTNIYVMRFLYNSATKSYSVEGGFPVAVYNRGVETVVMDRDTTGKLWVTFTSSNSSGGRNTYVTHSTTSDATWIPPYVVPVSGANTLKSDDISTLIAYSGKIGVMWSNQNDSTVYFAYHPDGTADNNWILNAAVQSPKYADDHLNIKSLQADSAGQLFAVVKTSLDEVNSSTSTKPLVLLLQLDNQGNWSRRTVWRIVDHVTRPIVLLDQQNRRIYTFATVDYGSQTSGGIYYKSVSLDDPGMQFVDGRGTPFITFSTDTHINNASSTKQVLNNTTNLMVIAGDDNSHYYFHNKIVLGPGSPAPGPVFADVTSGPYRPSIEAIYYQGITAGCATNPLLYCPTNGVTRAEMAVMLLRARYGSSYTPPTPTSQRFADVPPTHWAYAWIDKFAADGITTGCSSTNYCPGSVTTREQLAVFVLRARNGSNWTPPAYSAPYTYSDISNSALRNWIQNLASSGVIDYCATGQFCPTASATRERMAYFIAKLWGWAQ